MKFSAIQMHKLDKSKSSFISYFDNKTVLTLSICSMGYNIPLNYLNVKINNKEIKLFNVLNGTNLGNINYEIDDYLLTIEGLMNIEIDYDYDKNDKYNNDCYLIINYTCNTDDIDEDNNIFELRNSNNKIL